MIGDKSFIKTSTVTKNRPNQPFVKNYIKIKAKKVFLK